MPMTYGLKRYQESKQAHFLTFSCCRRRPFSTAWQTRYYDHNVWTYDSFVEKLRYIHRNPVKRGLVDKPEDWKWSSFRHYALSEFGPVEIESQWTADRRMGRTATMLQVP